MSTKAPKFKPIKPAEALRRLKEGNARFVNNVRGDEAIKSVISRAALANATQRPFAIILCCSDSRAPTELIFDQGIGDLFIVRVAGNIVAPSLVGSVEFAATTFGTQLVVVMGHTACGAIAATVDAIQRGKHAPSENIHDIIQRILPHVEGLVQTEGPRDKVLYNAMRANVRASVSELKHGSRLLEDLVQKKLLCVIGAEYDLASGEVHFFEDIK